MGFDGTPFLESLTGVGWYSLHLLECFGGMEGVRINLYLRTFCPGGQEPALFVRTEGLQRIHLRLHGIPAGILPGRAFWMAFADQVLTPLLVLLDGNDVFFAPNFFPPPAFHVAGRLAVTVHDCAFAVHPEFIQDETLENLRRHLPPFLHRAKTVLAVSQNTRRDLQGVLRVDAARAHAVLNGRAEPAPANARPDSIPRPFVLFVGTLEPRKNVMSLLHAFEILKAEGSPLHLALIGRMGWKSGPLQEALASSPWANDIHHLSYLPAGDVAAHYRKALCLAFVSHYEGFGLPILEAMGQGCPVVATSNSSLPEVGGDACLYVRPDPDSIAAGIRRIFSDSALRSSLAGKGYRQAAKFSWDRCAEETMAVLKEAAR